uniref:Uncharacterized protein n=1 Tax=Helianthus annuus TaxID=4232 RepID=A0A251RRM4_HELAN
MFHQVNLFRYDSLFSSQNLIQKIILCLKWRCQNLIKVSLYDFNYKIFVTNLLDFS